MISVTDALRALEIGEWTLNGEPNNETEFYENFKKVLGTDSDGNAILSSDQTKFGTTWGKIEAKMDELKKAEPMRLLRTQRNKKLAETDWWVLPDRTPTDAQKKYRQDLRDITKTATSLDDVTWPSKLDDV